MVVLFVTAEIEACEQEKKKMDALHQQHQDGNLCFLHAFYLNNHLTLPMLLLL